MTDSPLDAAAEMEFTPSKIDKLETISLPESEQHEEFWVIEEEEQYSRHFPGQMADWAARQMKRKKERVEKDIVEGRNPYPPPPANPSLEKFKKKLFPGERLFRPLPLVRHEEAFPEEHEASSKGYSEWTHPTHLARPFQRRIDDACASANHGTG